MSMVHLGIRVVCAFTMARLLPLLLCAAALVAPALPCCQQQPQCCHQRQCCQPACCAQPCPPSCGSCCQTQDACCNTTGPGPGPTPPPGQQGPPGPPGPQGPPGTPGGGGGGNGGSPGGPSENRNTNVNNVTITETIDISNTINNRADISIPINISLGPIQNNIDIRTECCDDKGCAPCPTGPQGITTTTTTTPHDGHITTTPTTTPRPCPTQATTPSPCTDHTCAPVTVPVPVPYPVPVPKPYPVVVPVPRRSDGCCVVVRPCLGRGCQTHHRCCECDCADGFLYQPVDPCDGGGCRRRPVWPHQSCSRGRGCRREETDCSECGWDFYKTYGGYSRCMGCFGAGY